MNYDAPQVSGAGMAYSAQLEARAVSPLQFADELANQTRRLTPGDVLDELADFEDALKEAERSGPEVIGRVYLAAKTALAHRLALRVLGIEGRKA